MGILNVLFAHKLHITVTFHFMKIYSCYKDFALNLAAWTWKVVHKAFMAVILISLYGVRRIVNINMHSGHAAEVNPKEQSVRVSVTT